MNRSRSILPLLVSLAISGCVIPGPVTTPDAGTNFIVDEAPTSDLYGYTWDPEAFFLSMLPCGPECPAGPLLEEGGIHFERSRVAGADVLLLDAASGEFVAQTTGDELGSWLLQGIPTRSGPPFLAFSMGGTLVESPPVPLPDIPPAGDYLPTMVLKPISPYNSKCYLQEAARMSSTGIIQAVAKYLSAEAGSTVTVDDLLDDTKYGGVFVMWLYEPGPPILRFPAFDTGLTASPGTVLPINWAEPGAVFLPPEILAIQSDRGFVVDPSNPESSWGVTAVVLPPSEEVPTFVTLTFLDPTGRLEFSEIEIPIVPGVVGFGALQLNEAPPPGEEGPGEPEGPPGFDPLPPFPWLCQ